MKIYISPSMQKYNAYAAGNTTEAEQCHRIGEFAEAALKRNGFDVKLADASHSAEQNVAESNAFNADYHVCIHTNAANGKARDVVVFTSDKNTADKCAVGVYNAIDALDGHKSVYGIRPANYYEIKYTTAKCVYIEAEFHDNAELAKWIIANAERIGEAIAEGFCKGVGKTYKAKEVKPMEVFKDIADSGFKSDIEWAASLGIANGYADGTFKPNEPCTRGQMCAFLHRLYKAIKEGK